MALVITSAVITTNGQNLLAACVASSGAITLTSVQFGSGYPAGGDNIAGYTALKNFIMNGQITGSNNLVQSQATIRVNVSSANAPSTFQVNEIGVFAQLGSATPILFAYTSTGGPTGDTVTPSSPTAAIVKDYALLILFSQAVPSSTTVSMAQVVGLHAPTHLDNGIDPIPPPTTARSGLLLANPNDGTQLLTGTNPPSWAPGLLVIRSNITLDVFIGASNVYPNFSTVQNALNYLIPYFIEPSFTVTISVAAGIYTSSVPITVNHPNGQQIQIIGTLGVSATGTSMTNPSGGMITIGGSSGAFTGISVGSFVVVKNAANFGPIIASGIWQVTATTSTSFTYATGYGGTWTGLASATSITVLQLATVLSFTAGVSGIKVTGNGLGLIENIALDGTESGTTAIIGMSVSNGAIAQTNTVGANGWEDTANNSDGFSAGTGALLTCTNSYSNQNSNGFFASNLG
jgi:hypothetical protein